MNLASFAELAVRLVNTAGSAAAADPLRGRDAFRDLTRDHPALGVAVTQLDLDRLRLLRTELAEIFALCGSGPASEAVTRLNDLLMIHPVLPVLTSHDGEPWHYHLNWSGSAADRYAAAAVFGLASLITTDGITRIGICQMPDCDRAFANADYDQSKPFCAEHRVQEAITSLQAQY